MSQKLCKNKKCQRPLPEGYKYKYCEHCRSERAQQIKRAGKAALGVVVMVGGTAVTVLSFSDIQMISRMVWMMPSSSPTIRASPPIRPPMMMLSAKIPTVPDML